MPDGLLGMKKDDYGSDHQKHLLEIYKLYVGSADQVSQRRATANNYLLTVNTFLVTLYGFGSGFDSSALWRFSIPVAGVLVCLTWWALIRSYRNLNTAKFAVIHELEQHLPVGVYAREWEHAEHGRGQAYHPLSHIEQWIPVVFAALYLVLAAYAVFGSPAKLRPTSAPVLNQAIAAPDTGNVPVRRES